MSCSMPGEAGLSLSLGLTAQSTQLAVASTFVLMLTPGIDSKADVYSS